MDSGSHKPTSAIDDIADSFVRRLRAGERPSIKEFAARYPEHAEEIREMLPTLAALEDLHPGHDDSLPTGPGDHNVKIPEQIGDYRILREIGRGGMGIVFEAEHRTMRRRVALKVLPSANLPNSHAVQRFHREARAAGQLHHTNIVPVFEVGKADGFFYYAMQFIHGQNLDVVIDEVRRLEREAHNRSQSNHHNVTQVATQKYTALSQSVAHNLVSGSGPQSTAGMDLPEFASETGDDNAHGDNAHGDNAHGRPETSGEGLPTPSNSSSWHLTNQRPDGVTTSGWTTIGERNETYFQRVARVGLQVAQALEYAHKHGVLHRDIKPSNLLLDTEGVVWITDFGLAKESGDELTHTGDVVGTLRYMAPERFKGTADARSDIYSLGLTLYELCTLQHAFHHSDRAQLVKQVTTHQPPRPRRVRPETPRDMETVILKAIDRDPARRYTSAAQFAADLQRFISDKPISARRVSFPERCWRWCRRNPFPAWLAACIAILLVTVALVSLRFAYVTGKNAKALERANLGGRAHLYHAYVGRAQAQRWSRRQGQNYLSCEMLRSASELLDSLELDSNAVERRVALLRNEYIASCALFDLKEYRRWDVTPGWTSCSAFDRGFQRYAQTDEAGNIQVRAVEDDQLLVSIPTPGHTCWGMQFSPDGRYLMSRHHHAFYPNRPEMYLWDLETQSAILEFPTGSNGRFEFTPDGQQLSVGFRTKELKFYRLRDAQLQSIIELDVEPWYWRFDEKLQRMVMVGSESRRVDFWTMADIPAVERSMQLDQIIRQMDWNERRNQLAVATANREIRVWNLDESDEIYQTFTGHLGRVVRLILRKTGDVVLSYGWDGTTRVFDLRSESEVLAIEGLYPNEIYFDDSDRKIAFAGKRVFGIWEIPENVPVHSLRLRKGYDMLETVNFHPHWEQLIIYPSLKGLVIWDFMNDRGLQTHTGMLEECRISPNGDYLFTCGPQGLQRWPLFHSIDDDEQVVIRLGEPELVRAGRWKNMDVDFERGIVAVVGRDGFASIMSLNDPSHVVRAGPHIRMNNVRIGPDGKLLFSSTWQGIGVRIWSMEDGKLVESLLENAGSCVMGGHPDSREMLIGSGMDRYRLNLDTLELSKLMERSEPDGWAASIAFSNSGDLVGCTYSRYRAELLDAKSKKSLAIFQSPVQHAVGNISFSASDRFVCISGPQKMSIWDLAHLRRELRSAKLDWSPWQPVADQPLTQQDFVFRFDGAVSD